MTSRPPPLAVQITDLTSVDEPELFRRVAAVASLAPEERARRVVMVREPQLGARELLCLAQRLREATRAVGAQLWVNDRLDVAALVEADGVHLGRRSVAVADARRLLGAEIVVSVACHAIDEVADARSHGADACTLSPIFASPGKASPLGTGAIGAARARLGEASGFSLVALGGIEPARIASCLAAGADGVAAIRGDVLAAPHRGA